MPNINFLKDRRTEIRARKKKDRKILQYGLIAFSICFAAFFAVTSYRIILKVSLNKIIKQQDEEKTVIDDNLETELEYKLLAHKLKLVKGVFDERSNKQEAIRFFTLLLANTTYNKGISYEEKKLTLKLQTRNIFTLEETLNLIASKEVTEKYSKIKQQEILRNNDGTYDIELIIDLAT